MEMIGSASGLQQTAQQPGWLTDDPALRLFQGLKDLEMSVVAQNSVQGGGMFLQRTLGDEGTFGRDRKRIDAVGELQEIGAFEWKLRNLADVGNFRKRRIKTGMSEQVLHVALDIGCS